MSPVSIEGDKFNKDQMKRGIFIYRCGESHIVLPDGKVKNITIGAFARVTNRTRAEHARQRV